MKQTESQPHISLIIAVPVSVIVGILFFMPWLSISFDMNGLVQMGGMPKKAALGPLPVEPVEVARTSGQQLTGGEVTITESAKKFGASVSDETNLPSRAWVYAGLALPVLLLAVCAMGLAEKISPVRAGKILFLLAFAGIVMMYTVSRISYVDDTIDKGRQEYIADEPAGTPAVFREKVERDLDDLTERLDKVIFTKSTGMLWVTMGAYAAVCVCGLAAIGSPTPASEMAIAERTAGSSRHDFRQPGTPTARPSFRDRRGRPTGNLPQFGPDLFAPPDSGNSDTKGTG